MARGKAEFVIDSGFLRGTDIIKAVARGATMVGIGKLQALALCAAGAAGVVRLLEILEAERKRIHKVRFRRRRPEPVEEAE